MAMGFSRTRRTPRSPPIPATPNGVSPDFQDSSATIMHAFLTSSGTAAHPHFAVTWTRAWYRYERASRRQFTEVAAVGQISSKGQPS
jgi:hypothetical protein